MAFGARDFSVYAIQMKIKLVMVKNAHPVNTVMAFHTFGSDIFDVFFCERNLTVSVALLAGCP